MTDITNVETKVNSMMEPLDVSEDIPKRGGSISKPQIEKVSSSRSPGYGKVKLKAGIIDQGNDYI